MPKPRKRPETVTEDVRTRWERALHRLHVLRPESPLPLFRTEPVLAAWIRALSGPDHEALRTAMHRILDRRLVIQADRLKNWAGGVSKAPAYGVDVDRVPLRLRLNDTRGIVVDIVGEGGMQCEGDIILDSVLPDSVLQSAVGRRADDIMANPHRMFDGSRKVVSAHVRFKRSTVLRLAKVTEVGLSYAELFGNPARRFAPNQMPIATCEGWTIQQGRSV